MTKILVQSQETIYYSTEIELPNDFTKQDIQNEIKSMLDDGVFDFSNGEALDFVMVNDWEIID